MKINNLEKFLAKIGRGETPLGCCITFTDPAVTELACEAGFDFVWIDGEHGEFDRTGAMLHLMSVKGTDAASFYRVPACDHTEIKRIIDFAPAGIIVPMVMNGDDARRAVAACRYPPEGNRGCGFRRGVGYGARDFGAYWEQAKSDPLVIIQLEHVEAVRNLDEILAVPGVGSIVVGPYDLSASMGKEGQWTDPEVAATYDLVCRKVREKGILLGVYTECMFDVWKRRGVQYFSIKNDTNAMMLGFKSMQERCRAAL